MCAVIFSNIFLTPTTHQAQGASGVSYSSDSREMDGRKTLLFLLEEHRYDSLASSIQEQERQGGRHNKSKRTVFHVNRALPRSERSRQARNRVGSFTQAFHSNRNRFSGKEACFICILCVGFGIQLSEASFNGRISRSYELP